MFVVHGRIPQRLMTFAYKISGKSVFVDMGSIIDPETKKNWAQDIGIGFEQREDADEYLKRLSERMPKHKYEPLVIQQY